MAIITRCQSLTADPASIICITNTSICTENNVVVRQFDSTINRLLNGDDYTRSGLLFDLRDANTTRRRVTCQMLTGLWHVLYNIDEPFQLPYLVCNNVASLLA